MSTALRSSVPWWWAGLTPAAIWGTTRLVNECGLRVTSGKRSVLQNLKAGGVKLSGHLTGNCTDMVGTMEQMQLGAHLARTIGCRQVLIHDAGSGVHLHCDWRAPRRG